MKLSKVSFFFLVALFFTVGCTEVECKKRYVTSVTVQALPSGFDLFSDPDLRCDITPSNSNYWSYISNSIDNVSGLPITFSFVSQNILLSKETWSMRLVDEDAIGEDIIYVSELIYFCFYSFFKNNPLTYFSF